MHSVIVVLFGILLSAWPGSAQIAPPEDKAKLFQAYFQALASEPHSLQRRDPHGADREHLIELIPTMTTAELGRVVSVIDIAIDQARATHDGIARIWAGIFLFYISGTPDGPGLLAPEVRQLSALCRDPFTLTGSYNIFGFLSLQYPELAVPAMLGAIKSPDANSPSGKGPAYATILFLEPEHLGLQKDVLLYMQRPDLKGESLLNFLTGISARSVMPEAVVEQLTHYLDAPQAEVRLAALRDISRGGFDERRRLKPTFERLVNEPGQSDEFHALAIRLQDSNEMFSLDPYQ